MIVEELKDTAKRITPHSVGAFIRDQREQAQVSLRQLAELAGVSNPYLSQIERGLRKPSAEILQQIAKGLRISAEQLYLQAGILEARDGDASTIAAIMADSGISERQKNVLVEIYESFRRENTGQGTPAMQQVVTSTSGASAGAAPRPSARTSASVPPSGARATRPTAATRTTPSRTTPSKTTARKTTARKTTATGTTPSKTTTTKTPRTRS